MLKILAASFVMASSAQAQEVITQEPFRPEPEIFDNIGLHQITNSWNIRESDTDAASVRKELEQSGFDIDPQTPWLGYPTSFSLFSSSTGPGQVSYLVVPNDINIPPTTYSPSIASIGGATAVEAGFTADKIIENLKESIRLVCDMGAVPQTITGEANAVVIQFSATWEGDAICASVSR